MRIKIPKYKLVTIIRECIEKLMTESLSVSDEVKAVCEEIIDQIQNGTPPKIVELYGLGEYQLRLRRVPVDDKDTDLGAHIDFKLQNIDVDIPVYNSVPIYDTVFSNLYHEITHAYQRSLKGNPDVAYNKYYNIATNKLKNRKAGMRSDELDVAYFIYCCTTWEQDAFAHELYNNIIRRGSSNNEAAVYENSQMFKAREFISEMLEKLATSFTNNRYKKEIAEYGHRGDGRRWLFRMGQFAIKRIDSKTRNVFMNARNHIEDNCTQNVRL